MSDRRTYWRSSLCDSSRESTRSGSCMRGIMLVLYRPNRTLLLRYVSCSSRRASILSCSFRELSFLSLRPAVEGKEEDFFFCRGGGAAGGEGMGTSGGQLVGQGVEQDMVLVLARTSTTLAVPSSLSSPEEALGPAAVASFADSCKCKSAKHGLDNMKVIQ